MVARRLVVPVALIAGALGGVVGWVGAAEQPATPAAASSPTSSPSAAGASGLDPVHSSVHFRVKNRGIAYVYGRFDSVSGSMTFDSAAPGASSLSLEVNVESVNTNAPKRDQHLRSGDFFNAAQFPKATFVSKSFKPAGENRFEVSGDFTVHGLTRPLTVTLEHTGSAKVGTKMHHGFHAEFEIKRSDFGITYLPQGIEDTVRLVASLEFIQP